MGNKPNVDAVVIGAGFAGLYMVYRLREMGFSYRAFEKAAGVGGTWYWNRYPGAASDSQSWVYAFTFSKELEQEWNWSCRYPGQAEILRYLDYVAERFDLKRGFDFSTAVTAAHYAEGVWTVTTDTGEQVTARYLITAVGCLSAAQVPDIPGRQSFAGQAYHTSDWPHEGVDFAGKRVGVIGTGSSGIQAVPVIAEQAAHLTVFQRTAQFSIPAGNRSIDAQEMAQIKRDIRGIHETCRWSMVGHPYDLQDTSILDVDEQTRNARFEADWQTGGFEWVFGSHIDVLMDQRANDLAADFARDKIRQAVNDPETARKLTPQGYPIATKRLPLDTGYFEAYNRDNVDLVALREEPIEAIDAEGIRTSEKHYPLDCIVFATGFDAMTGALEAIDIRGQNGVRLADKWKAGPRTYLGIATAGFPNLFIITGPGSPSVLGNMPTAIEQHVDFLADLLSTLRERDAAVIEPEQRAEDDWVDHVNEAADATLFPQANSWYMGANIPGKPRLFIPYIGGFGAYRKLCDDIAEKGYEGFVIS